MKKNTTIGNTTLKKKTIKVGYKSREHCAPVNAIYSTSWVQVPKLQMEGNWLEELGFHVGEPVTVIYEKGRITLLAASAAETSTPSDLLSRVAEPNTSYQTR